MSTTAIIVIGVAFVLVDGFVLYKVLMRSRRGADATAPRDSSSQADATNAFGEGD